MSNGNCTISTIRTGGEQLKILSDKKAAEYTPKKTTVTRRSKYVAVGSYPLNQKGRFKGRCCLQRTTLRRCG